MEQGFDIKDALTDILSGIAEAVASFAPRLLMALVIIMIGMLVAMGIRRLLRTGLQKVRFDTLLEKLGIAPMFQRLGIRRPPSTALEEITDA